ncbi:DUF2723 domain-containing protein [Flavobacteriaceae bacterium R38]|nr:DUF2723 domain-containing protein [Flavobacteriaceae bacterium R38]
MWILQFKKWNTLLGWFTFFIALITYGLTVEPTASFWDCSEFITTSAKLQVGHPPGAPLFQMMGAFFSSFASDAEQVAKMVNYVSVSSSAFTILLLFWIITNLLKKLVAKEDSALTRDKGIAILSSGLIGALAFTFSDTFWFSAVEAEVYAMAILFMALIFWLALKWIDRIDSPGGNKWLLLISLVIGLSFGVHFMALLAIPAVVMIYYFKSTKKTTIKSFIVANITAVAVLLFIFKLLLPYTLKFFGYSEVFFVNTFGLPFNSGTIIAGIVIITLFYFGLKYTRIKGYIKANTLVLCTLFILIGFSSWLMIPIRANANVNINLFNPSDARQLLAYYNLEQYPETHLFHGPMFSDMFAEQDPDNPYKDDKPKYEQDRETGKYIIVNKYKNAAQSPNSNHVGLFPRMWSNEHAENYMMFTGLLDFKIKPEFSGETELKNAVANFKSNLNRGAVSKNQYIGFLQDFRGYLDVEKPSLWDNLNYFFEYQVGYMYWRYFMWNFSGRQDDIQGEYNNHGNWLSGINVIDQQRLGSQKNLPSDIKNNKARNTYYLLPLLLGLIGLIFQLRKNPKQFWILGLLFLFTGIALKVYLNERPFEPRERDYVLVGSFYVFAIWIGIGGYALITKFRALLSFNRLASPALAGLCLLSVPVLMAYQNWDDHDRSNRYTAQAMAKAYLDSIQEDKNAILFTMGDNDTYSLWYAQEIEGYRRDVKTVNSSSLLSADWHIDQVKRKSYESDAVPSQLTHKQYAWGVRDIIRYEKLTDSVWSIQDFMDWVASDDPKTQYGHLVKQFGGNPLELPESTREMIYYPTNKIRVPVDKENVLKSGVVKEEDAHLIVDYIDIDLPENYIPKNRLMMLDILANNNWERPIYFIAGVSDPAEYIWMKDYLQLDGLVYKLVPIKTPVKKENPFEIGRIDSDLMYDTIMKWKWGNSDTDIYHDPRTRVNGITYRTNMARLVEKLIEEDQFKKAEKVIDLAMEKMPADKFGYYVFLEPFIEGYYKVSSKGKARDLYKNIAKKYQEYLDYYHAMNFNMQYKYASEIATNLQYYENILQITIRNDEDAFARNEFEVFNSYIEKFQHLFKNE